MSGGSMDYLYQKIGEASFRLNTAERKAFAAHLKKVAVALHCIEWNDSLDGEDGEREKIMACLSAGAPLAALLADARLIGDELSREMIAAGETLKKLQRGGA